ncbi:MAG: Transcriptional regulator, MerR family / Transcriptional regulator, TetR family [Myxococcaceae bacterium]|nr:Transcriptional regulator, MerR family / Transcriptional regulator, TetR family [Myxococcaceae bacterium]
MVERRIDRGPRSLKIGQLERASKASRSTIRHYESLGLLPPCEILGPKLHLYGPEHVGRLAEIRRLRERGIALRDMKPLLSHVRPHLSDARRAKETGPTRERILGEAVRQLLAVGYHGLRLDTLAKSMRIAKPTIYRHFASKQALFLEAVNAMRIALVPQKERERGLKLDAPAQARLRARAVLENFGAYRGLYTLLQTLTHDGDPVVAQRANQELHAMVTNAEPFLRRSIEEGRFRAFDSELLAYILWGALMGAGEFMRRRSNASLEEVVTAYVAFTATGVLARSVT